MVRQFGDMITGLNPGARITLKAAANRTGFAESTCDILFRDFTKRGWCSDGGPLEDGRRTWVQSLPMRRGWEKYREAMGTIFEERCIDPQQEAALRLKQLGLVDLDEELEDE